MFLSFFRVQPPFTGRSVFRQKASGASRIVYLVLLIAYSKSQFKVDSPTLQGTPPGVPPQGGTLKVLPCHPTLDLGRQRRWGGGGLWYLGGGDLGRLGDTGGETSSEPRRWGPLSVRARVWLLYPAGLSMVPTHSLTQ